MITTPEPIRIAAVQCDLIDNDIRANLEHLERLISQHSGSADLFVLPEVFTTGFAPDAGLYADSWESGVTLPWLQSLSQRYGIGIAGSFLVRAEGVMRNRFVLIDGADVSYQDKRHLFSLGGETDTVSATRERNILNFRGWRILPVICYDLRFPVWCRNVQCEYDVIVAVASWPSARRLVWQTLLRARAMENLAYCIGVNRIGQDKSTLSYTGDTAIIDPRGREMSAAPDNAEYITRATLDYAPLHELRRKFPVWRDADEFDLKL